jgi:quercetin dioxygenase-like cupin family protein
MLDLPAELARLRAEPHRGAGGHRQVTLFHRPPLSHVLFSFEAGGTLKRHAADGQVTIHVLEGHLVVDTDAGRHTLRAGQIMILSQKVAHAVRAPEPSAMLLTVAMGNRDGE